MLLLGWTKQYSGNSKQHCSLHLVILWFVESYTKHMIFTICIWILFNILRITVLKLKSLRPSSYWTFLSIYTYAQKLLYDNTIAGFNTLVALITFESTSDKGHTYPQFLCRHGFVFWGVLLWLVLLLMLAVLFVSVNGLFVVDG